jgi:transposase-like protein
MTDEPKHAGGRPSDYSEELSARICARLAAGESMRTVCKDDDMPSAQTLFSWMRKHSEFLEQYTRAKEESADALIEESLDIADDGTNDWMEKHNADGENIGWTLNGEHVQRSKLRIDTRKWMASKLKPKKYGDRLEHTGSINFTNMSEEELDQRIAQRLAQQTAED